MVTRYRQRKGCPIFSCNGKRVGSPEFPQKDQAVPIPEAGKETGPISEAGQVEASPRQEEAGLAEAGQVGPNRGLEAVPAEAEQVRSSPGQEAGQAEAGQVGTSPGQEAGLAKAGLDGLGQWVSAPNPEEREEEVRPGSCPTGL
ncbi:hypothetical protein E2C01_052557 [Portunus trituberculatus]|uniref:Uncharacterized protein n=1 Tax=Portunus trituberculatus TaxID=210409 RepID=A0A5B7GEY6_PORTR|nr:hypothetical protein [Portunus trituberculatus]